MRLCAVSVDLDEIPNYFAIHGLPAPRGRGATAVYDVAIGRLSAFARSHGIPLTLFAIGSDLSRPENGQRLRDAAAAGHELGNHTLDHAYDLSRLSDDAARRQIEGGAEAIASATGTRPTGFRAPGYTITDALFRMLADLGVQYDSSVFPSPPYYAAKAAKLAVLRAVGRRSQSILDTPSVLKAPTRPYRVGVPYWTRGTGMLELPVQVTRGPRLPFIGTTITLAGASRARWLTRLVVGEPLVNLELHGIDVLDCADGFPELENDQPDAAILHEKKLEALGAVVETLRNEGYSFVRLDEAARAF